MSPSHATLANHSEFTKTFVNDRVIKELFTFPNMTATGDSELEGMDTGVPLLDEVSTTGIGAPLLTTTDSYSFMVPMPQDIDLDKDVCFRYQFSNHEAAATGSYIPTMEYTIIHSGVTAMAVGSSVIDSIFSSQVDLAANIPLWTAWGTINASKLSAMDADNDHLNVQLTATLTTVASISALRGQMLYYRKTVA